MKLSACLKGLRDIYDTKPNKNTTKQNLLRLNGFVVNEVVYVARRCARAQVSARACFRREVDVVDVVDVEPVSQSSRQPLARTAASMFRTQASNGSSVIPVGFWLLTWIYGDDTTSKTFSSH